MTTILVILGAIAVLLVLLTIYDLTQRKHAILRNFPLIGHLRYILEAIGPELRQYIVTDNDSERPFSRDQRRWVYATSKKENSYFGFGTDNDLEREANYLIIKQSAFPINSPRHGEPGYDPLHCIPCAKIIGEHRGRAKAFRPASVVNVSGMSYGALGKTAVEAINRGCEIAGCLHNTGEGGISPYHLNGADIMLQVGTGYFACRDERGRFSMTALEETIGKYPQVKAIEIKLSQGAKAGIGGLLPKAKITPEIAAARGVPADRDCASPAAHTEFKDADGMLDFVESIADKTGLPVGIKSAVGESEFWQELAHLIESTGRAVDFINIDGGEGGTGAGPLVYTDHVALPFKIGFRRVYREFVERNLHQKIVFGGAGKLGFPEQALFAFAMGCDMVQVAREAMLSIGCIQAQRCHTGHCPAGVATHNPWLMRGLDPTLKAARLANYLVNLRAELLKLSHTCGVMHPGLVTTRHFEILDPQFRASTIEEAFSYGDRLAQPSAKDRARIEEIMGGSGI
jgi:glutamate synthase domain-containing protein 2